VNNRQQNRQFKEAIRRIEAVLQREPARELSKDERRRLHDEITRQGVKTIDEIVKWGLALFPE
jgi:hypothetical protein